VTEEEYQAEIARLTALADGLAQQLASAAEAREAAVAAKQSELDAVIAERDQAQQNLAHQADEFVARGQGAARREQQMIAETQRLTARVAQLEGQLAAAGDE
jgi:chromosome segregation ATPase